MQQKGVNPSKLSRVVATDCGSTTTKALMFEKINNQWRFTYRGEAPTTVEAPVEDVTVGALNAFQELEELSKKKFLKEPVNEKEPFLPLKDSSTGIDIYLSTSSAGGGLQMLVTGIVKEISAASAQRAALGAGAIVLDVISVDDGREDFEKIKEVRHLKPDIVLMAGGTEGGDKAHNIETAEILLAAAPRPRFGKTLNLPVIYAGNKEAYEEVKKILSPIAKVVAVKNVRASLDEEDIKEAREAIHEFFLSHVMSHSPGYDKLLQWTAVPIMPTPAAVGKIIESYAKASNQQILCVDIGGATTDVFSVIKNREAEWRFNRTVSANYGMSYSIANVLLEAGANKVKRWLPFSISEEEINNMIYNKMIRPTSIPFTIEELALEQALCREALRLSLKHHIELTKERKRRGVQGIAGIFSQQDESALEVIEIELVIGSGGVLSHAPHRLQAALMMIEGFELQGFTQIVVDSVFMLPHLGVFSTVNEEAAHQILINDCLINVAYSVVPVWRKLWPKGTPLAELFVNDKKIALLRVGDILLNKEFCGKEVVLTAKPLKKDVRFSTQEGKTYSKKVVIGEYGLIIDCRGRPLQFAVDNLENIKERQHCFTQLGFKFGDA
ncbi:MAG: methylaspartate mutase [Candidatus Dadabacteria bacterium]|nr:MAG: methylaspartate mutase [Candidatus Dadabacteria bacterium]